ncbi:MAG: hypothetical protein KAJ09_07115 [Deltaproteobacteria bacterium]|nr:hypothetical protein [Deltaproteobacteria bacterium]
MERKKGVAIINKAIIPLVFTILFSALAHAQMEIYSWRDRTGTIHIVDDLNKVPLHYREDMKIYRIPPTRVEKQPRSKPSVRAVTKVEEGEEEGALKEERLEEEIEEVGGSIIGLEERLEELRQEREKKRIYIIKKRAMGHPVVREKRELEGIDREIEILTNQLGKRMEALRLLEQERSLQGGR